MFTPDGMKNQSALGMLEQLEKYYLKQRISAIAFNCENISECSAGCKPGDFVTAREAFVGSEYEKGTLPRLLFISLDASDEWPGPEPENRTLQAVRAEVESAKLTRRGTHWRETHELAHGILDSIATERLGHSLSIEQINRYFAHTNSAKCKDKSMGTRQGRPVLFKNCRPFIHGEVEILCPDILVTQGRWARESIRAAFRVLRQEWMPDHSDKYGYKVIEVAGRQVISFETAHQRAFGLFWPEKEIAYPWYKQEALQFVRKFKPWGTKLSE
jgi:hypothetical protein